jgi:hypothetical protein
MVIEATRTSAWKADKDVREFEPSARSLNPGKIIDEQGSRVALINPANKSG